jgi:hypothetical protein
MHNSAMAAYVCPVLPLLTLPVADSILNSTS